MEGANPDAGGSTVIIGPDGDVSVTTGAAIQPFPKKQYGVAVDLLSAGEIHGIVGGLSGVYLNNAKVVEDNKWLEVRPTVVSGYNSAGAPLTFTTDQAIPSDMALPQYGIVRGGMGSFTTTAAASVGERRLTFGGSAFSANQATLSVGMRLRHVQLLARIVLTTGDYWVPVNYVQNTTDSAANYITLATPLSSAVPSGTVVHVDWGGKITSSTSSSITFNLTGLPSLNPTTFSSSSKTNIRLLGGVNTPADSDVKNFKETFVDYRKGSRFQQGPEGIGSAPAISFVLGRNDDLGMYSGISNVPGTLSTTAQTTIDHSAFSFGQSTLEEIDTFQLDIEFPGGLWAVSENGTQYDTFVDFQVIFEYSNNSEQGSYNNSVLVAGKDYGGNDFVDALGYSSGAQRFRNDLIPRDRFSSSVMAARSSSAFVRARAQRTKFIKSIYFDVTRYQPFTEWRIKVRRLVPSDPTEWWSDNSRTAAQCASILKTVTAAAKERLMYPMSAYAVVGFSAQDFPNPPKRSYKIKGKKIKVPTNYFTRDERRNVEAKYTRNKSTGADASSYVTWDGTFRGDPSLNPSSVNYHKVYCNNPAWIFYDILTDKEIGLGEFINESDIDIYGLYQIARYCDELVPNGKGGQEPRFTCNVYFSKKKEAYKVLKDLASTFRSMMYWIDGNISLIQDKPKEPVYTFTTGNVRDGIFNYTYTGDKARTNQVRVAWNNPRETYKQTVVTVDDLPNIAQQGKIVAKDVVAFGCTSESQAKRVGLWHLETDTRETEIITFNTGLNAAYLRPGDIINVQDKRQNNIIASGRVSTGSTSTSIVLDRTVTFPGGVAGDLCNLYLIYDDPGIYLQEESATINSTTYTRGELIRTKADGTSILTGATESDAANFVDDSGNVLNVQFAKTSRVEVQAISNSGSSASTITTPAFAGGAPAQDTIWAISREDDVATEDIKEYRIAGISEIESNEYEITATQYTREKFDEIEVDRKVVTDNFVEISSRGDVIPFPQETILVTGHDEGLDTITAELSWETPTESFTDSAGTTATIPYRFLQGYVISHNFSGNNASDSGRSYGAPLTESTYVSATTNAYTFFPRTPGLYTVSIRSVNDLGESSREIVRTVEVREQGEGFSSRVSEYQNITGLGGTISHSSGTITTSSTVDITTRLGTYINVSGEAYDFTSMGNNAEAFLFFDGNLASPSLKRTLLHEDSKTDCDEINAYLKEVGASNNGLSSITGQIQTITAGSARVLGNSSTTFTSDFSEGDLIKFSTSSAAGTEVAASEYKIVTRIESDRVLYVGTVFQDRGNSLISASNIYAFKQSLGPVFREDALVARLTTDGSGTYTYEDFVVPTTRNATRNTGALADLDTVNLTLTSSGGVSGTLPAGRGGTGITNFSESNFANTNINYASDGSGTLPAGRGGTGLTNFSESNFANTNINYASDGSGTLPAGRGGTGLTSTTTLLNSNVGINADGTLSGAGSGQVSLYGLNLPSGSTGGGFILDPNMLHGENWGTGSSTLGCSRSESGSPDDSPMYSVNGTTKAAQTGSFCQPKVPPYATTGGINQSKVMEMEPQVGSSYYCKLLIRVTSGWTSPCARPKLALKDADGAAIGTKGNIEATSDDGSASYNGDYPEFYFLRSNGSYTGEVDQIAIDAGAGNWVWAVGKFVVEGGTLGNIKYSRPYFFLDSTNPGGGTFDVAFFQVYDHDPEGVSPAQAGRNLIDQAGNPVSAVTPTALTEDFSHGLINRFTARWSAYQDIGGEETIVTDSSSPQGSYVLQLGNNSGDDEVWRSLPMADAIPIEENAIYKIRAIAARTAGSGTMYFGINGVNADKTAWVRADGVESSSMSSAHYIAASNHAPADTNYHEYVGYFYRDSSSGSSYSGTNANTIISPARIDHACIHAVPMFIANYNNDPGTVRIAFIELEKVIGFGADSQVFLNSEFNFGSDGTGTLLNTRGGTGITNFSNSTHLNANTTASQVGLGNVANERQITIFRQAGTPTALAVGDLWVDTDDGNLLYRASATGTANWDVVGAGTSAANITAGTLLAGRGGTGITTFSTADYANINVNYASDGSGILPISNGGTNTTNSATFLNTGVTTATITSGGATHSWNISGTDYSPSSTTQATTIQWRDGAGTLLKTKTVTTTLQVSTDDADIAYSGDSGVTMSPATAPSGVTSQEITATYNGITVSVDIYVIDMSGWTFK